MISVKGPINTGVAAGGAGVATNSATTNSKVSGKIIGLYVRYNDSPPAGTTDLTVKTAGNNTPAYNVWKAANAATDGYFAIRQATVSPANAANTNDYEALAVDDNITVLIEGANNGDSADVWLFIEN